jgi:hypothetical protein
MRQPEANHADEIWILRATCCDHDPSRLPPWHQTLTRLVEVTPDKDIVFDLRIGGGADDPRALSVFRSEFVPMEMMRA